MPSNKIQDLFNVDGLVAVITGGGSGLGLYAARALDANGAKAVYIVGRRQETLAEAAKTGVNGKIIPIVGDVTDKESLKSITNRIREEQGYINLLFANAGVVGPRVRDYVKPAEGSKATIQDYQRLLEPEIDDFTATFHINVSGVFYTAIAFLDLLDAGNKKHNLPQDSQIIVTSSVAGYNRTIPAGYSYSTSKAAVTYEPATVNHLVKTLSTTFAQNAFRIRCNLIAPGLYPSEMTTGAMKDLDKFQGPPGHENDFEGAAKLTADSSPSERSGSEQDFAGTILFMASRAGAYLNGETLITDGGRLSQKPSTY